MNRTRVGIILLAVFACAPIDVHGQVRGDNRLPQMPWARGGMPCADYCGEEWRTCRSVPMFDSASAGATLRGWIPPQERLAALDGRVVVETPGVVIFRDTFQFIDPGPGHTLPPEERDTLRFTRRDTVYVFDWDSDGDGTGVWHLWFRGRPLETQQFWKKASDARSRDTAVMIRTPGLTYWVKVRRDNGDMAWVIYDSEALAGVNPKYDRGPEECAPIR